MSGRGAKPLIYSELDIRALHAYRLRFRVEEWACIAELLRDAPYGIDDLAREVLGDWTGAISQAYDIEPRRVVVFEAPQKWADYLWYVLTLPSAGELEDIGRSLRAQVLRANRDTRRRNRDQYWESLRTSR
ncbi:hypothetical protein ACFV42_46495 [Streptomyces solisilvae]|uniref:hypothetical protein n=1 Tax=Streptomyces malaysiensis TaxID=92644 RepID=UPI003692AAE1